MWGLASSGLGAIVVMVDGGSGRAILDRGFASVGTEATWWE